MSYGSVSSVLPPDRLLGADTFVSMLYSMRRLLIAEIKKLLPLVPMLESAWLKEEGA
jgi:hypothetical protein